MKKVLLSMFGVLFVSLFLIHGVTSANEITTNTDEIFVSLNPGDVIEDSIINPFGFEGPTYPGTNIQMKAGDVLYSSKSLGTSTWGVGHVGIVGTDYNVYHVNKIENRGLSDGLYLYMSRHRPGEKLTILRPRGGYGTRAALWAENNYSRVTQYQINTARLSTISPNYCSKFVWQAFYYGEGINIANFEPLDDTYTVAIGPLLIENSLKLARYGSFYVPQPGTYFFSK